MKNYTLMEPISGPWGAISTVTLRPVKVRDMKAVEKVREQDGDMGAGIALLAAVCSVPVDAVEEMDARDFTALTEMLTDFLPKASP